METETDRVATEIAHVLFVDIVGFSLLPMEKQPATAQELRQIVRNTHEYQRANARGELLCLDLGDGMAIVFFRDPVAPAQCAIDIAAALRNHAHLGLRMGIHSGPVSRLEDINGKENVGGSGINMGQRVMDCGDAGHILVSGSSAEFLSQFEGWESALYDLGECEVKHGIRIHLFNLHKGEVGNPLIPHRLIQQSSVLVGLISARETPNGAHVAKAHALEAVGGAVPLESAFYIQRPADAEFNTALLRHDSIVLVKGARQIGKTSLLARGLQQARQHGARVVLTDLQKFTAEQMATADALFRTVAETMIEQLELEAEIEAVWKQGRGWNVNFERFLRREVLGRLAAPLVWGLDEADRLFHCGYGSEVFGLFRSWHNERSLDPSGPWSRLTLAIAYATEAHLFITDLNQSPFNVGTRLTLEDFTLDQVADLNRRYGEPLRTAGDLDWFYGLVSGHPYLVRRGLDVMVTHSLDMTGLEEEAGREDGVFGDHLRRIHYAISQDSQLVESVRALLGGASCPSQESFYRLRSAGVIAGASSQDARLRCRLYQQYLARRLT